MMKGLVGAFKVTKWGPQAIAFTLVEGLVVAFTGSEAQSAYGLASDFMSGAIFTGFAKGALAGGKVISQGIKDAIGFALAGDWKGAWDALVLSLETGWRTLMANMSDGVKGLVDALNNFKSGSFVSFLRTIYRGFSSVVNAMGQLIDGVVWFVTLGKVKDLTGAKSINEHLNAMQEYDDRLAMESGNTFFANNDARLKQLEEEKRLQDQTLAKKKHEAAQVAKDQEGLAWRARQLEEQRAKLRAKRDKALQAEESRKKKMQRDELARMKAAHEEERKKKIEVAKEQLKQLGIIAKVEADAEGERESAKFSRMSEVTRRVTRAGIGGLGGEGVMRQFAEKQNDIHKQNLDSQHRQESELRQINVQLKKYALESLLLKP